MNDIKDEFHSVFPKKICVDDGYLCAEYFWIGKNYPSVLFNFLDRVYSARTTPEFKMHRANMFFFAHFFCEG